MIILSAFGPTWGLPDPSPFVMKTQAQLTMARLPFRCERRRPPEGPKNKVPFIEDDGELIGDSTFIRDHIERKYGVVLDAGLTPRQRALAWTVERTVEDHIYFATLYGRWAIDENFAKGPAMFFAGAPEEVRAAGREATLRNLYGQGLGRHSLAEVADLAGRSFKALSVLLDDQPFITGELVAGADATLYSGLAAALTPYFDTPIRDALVAHQNLVDYVERMAGRNHPQRAAAAEPA